MDTKNAPLNRTCGLIRVMPTAGLGFALALFILGTTPSSPPLSVKVLLEARSSDIDLAQVEVIASAEGLDQVFKPENRDGGSIYFELPADRQWSITCRDETLWCPSLSIKKALDLSIPMRRRLPVVHRVRLQAKLETSQGDLPERVNLQAWEANSPFRDRPLELELTANVEEGRIHLELPDIPLDLRLAATGFSPIYTWGLRPSKQPKARQGLQSLGTWTLKPGSSLCGFVVDGVTGAPVPRAAVRLRLPSHRAGTPIQTARRLGRMVWRTQSNERGFFQVVGPPAGVYRLEVTPSGDGQLPKIVPTVELEDQSETCLDALEVQEAIPFRVLLDIPPVTAASSWQVRLSDTSRDGYVDPKAAQKPDIDGLAHFQVAPGTYQVTVFSSEPQMRVLSREVSVQVEETLPIQLDVLPVEGHVSLGETPLVAAIDLSAGDGSFARLESDAKGRFLGWSRRPDEHLIIQLKAVHPSFSRYVLVDDFDIEEGVLRIELEFPNRRVTGIVQDPEGRPVRLAKVRALPEMSNLGVSTQSNVEGRFELAGLEDSPLFLQASARGFGHSKRIRVQPWGQGVGPDITLVLRQGQALEGRVSTDSMDPVAGARVSLILPGTHPRLVSDVTSVEGRFEVNVPETATQAVVQVYSSRLNWSACLALPSSGQQPLDIRLPPTSGGAVRLTWEEIGDPTAQIFLINADGGFFTWGQLLNYGDSRTTVDGRLVSAMAPGFYGIWSSSQVLSDIAALACARSLPIAADQALAPGQELHLHLAR